MFKYSCGHRAHVTHYRPISKMSCIPKIFEKIVTNQTAPLFCNMINESQYGFVKGRSSVINLLVYKQALLDALEKRAQVDSIYTDFFKAFDRV